MDALAQRAIQAVETKARQRAGQDKDRARSILGRYAAQPLTDQLVSAIGSRSRVTVNYHPDRLSKDGKTVARSLLDDGEYQTQFLSGISNGGRMAVPGGGRPRWESELFDGVYDGTTSGRPVYGALDLTLDPHGGAPRFGSCFLVLTKESQERSTFCIGDSHENPTDIGSTRILGAILAGLLEQATTGNALHRGITVDRLVQLLTSSDATIGAATVAPERELDGYVEAQIHGGVRLATDVDFAVLDPSFRSSDVEYETKQAGQHYGFDVRWHRGSEVKPAQIPEGFRGPDIVELASRVANSSGLVNAALVGEYAKQISYTPPSLHGDASNSERQQVKRLWHCLLAFGHDAIHA